MIAAGAKRFRNRPDEIEAMLFDGANARDIIGWLGEDLCGTATPAPGVSTTPDALIITTPEGGRRADVGDWIVKGRDGSAYPMKSLIFISKFEALGEG
ncbi:MAG: hypothetical protein JSR99_07435 [Proteobacteria bacterium]|nr:hypothetical protein [Pseudomonadota bacterium]